jgi:alanine-synthesizing transaminase
MPRQIIQSRKLHKVRYDVRGPILVEAERLEAQGHKVLKLNIGNTAPFGFEAPEAILADMVAHLPEAQGYSDSRGIYSARTAVAQYYQSKGLRGTVVDDVFIGNGVSELISMVLTAFLDDGNEVLVPAPDYPLWTGAVTLAGGTPVHYRCDEDNGWNPDLEDIESKITENTHALVVINPNNPTGAVYSEETIKGLVDIARRHQLVLMADEIYEKILYPDDPDDPTGSVPTHHHVATYAGDDVLTLTFSGLSKAYRVCGYRAGWVMISGPKHLATDFLEGLTLLANMRMCANVPAQHAIQTALGGYQSINELIVPGGRFYEQIKLASRLLNEIPGVSCVEPRGALYCFPRLDPAVYQIEDDQQFVLDLLRAKKILVTHGTGFNWFAPDHFRLVTLPDTDLLTEAIGRIAEFLETLR